MVATNIAGGTGASVVGQRRVDWTRQLARRQMAKPDPDIALVFEIVSEGAEEAMAATPAGPDLRAWQLLATDLTSLLRPRDTELAERARKLAGRLRSLVGLMARAPAERLAIRPAARRVLSALIELGGEGLTLSEVRERTGLGATHMSNIIRALAAHALISVEADARDGRGRRVSVTSAGRTAVGRADAKLGDRFDSYLSDEPPRLHRATPSRSYTVDQASNYHLENAG